MDLSKRLKDFCRVRGTNRTALEKKLNLGNGTIGKWWKNGRVPNYANLLAVANELETTVAYLSGETDDPEIKKALGDNVEGSASGEAEFMQLWSRLSPERQARELAFLREEVLKSEAEQDS